jgi:hypothetical protein
MAFDYKNYLVLAFEDISYGGDKDYNDVVFAVDIGEANLMQLATVSAAAPEPTQWAGIGLAILIGWRLQRLQKSQFKAKSDENSES